MSTNRATLINDLTEGPLTKQMMLFSLPVVLGNLLHTLYNLVDMAVVGQFVGSEGLSAVSTAGQITILLYCLGIGFGRAVPEKHRFSCCFDMGVQFWGSPSVYVRDHKLTEQDVDGEDGGALKTLSKVTVCPAISFRIVGRIF